MQRANANIDVVPFDRKRDQDLYLEGDTDAFRQSFPGLPVTADVLSSIHGSIADLDGTRHGAAFTALADHQPVGFVVVSILSFYSIPQGYIESIYVKPTVRGAGIGKALVERAVEYCRQQGSLVLKLDVSENNRAAIELYEAEGFAFTRRQMERWVGDGS